MILEDYTNKGRIDLTILYENKAYILEFKVVELEGKTPKAIEILKQKAYPEKYRTKTQEIYLIGIDFSKDQRNIVSVEWTKL